MSRPIHGVIPPIVTPFNRGFDVDEKMLRALVNFLLDARVHALVTCGTTGEFPMLSYQERKSVTEIVADEVRGRVPLIEGVTAVRTEDAVMFAEHAREIGFDAVMAAPSYYFKLEEEELYDYFASIAKVDIPVIVYNNPSTTKTDLTPAFLAKLSKEYSAIRYVKESSGDLRRIREIKMQAEGRLDLICGEDTLIHDFFALGAVGWISTTSNAIPEQCVQMYDTVVKRKDLVAGMKLMYDLLPAINILDGQKGIQAVKAALRMQGMDVGSTRKPLLPLKEPELSVLKEKLTELGVLDAKIVATTKKKKKSQS